MFVILNQLPMSDFIHQEKHLTYLLRHDHENYPFGIHAWREVSDLVENHGYSREELEDIVANSSKQRFEFSDDGLWIRACYGHSFKVDLQLEPAEPPEYLLHGTVVSKLPSIMEKGLLPMSRNQVHLSVDMDTAMKVGARRKGEVVILRVAAHKMWEDGHRFGQARNGTWLTDTVPPKYLNVIKN